MLHFSRLESNMHRGRRFSKVGQVGTAQLRARGSLPHVLQAAILLGIVASALGQGVQPCNSCCTVASGVLSTCSGCPGASADKLDCSAANSPAISTIAADAFQGVSFQGGIDFDGQGLTTLDANSFRGVDVGEVLSFQGCVNLATIHTAAFKDATVHEVILPEAPFDVKSLAFEGALFSSALAFPRPFHGTLQEQALAKMSLFNLSLDLHPSASPLPSYLLEGTIVADVLEVSGGSLLSTLPANVFAELTFASSATLFRVIAPFATIDAGAFANMTLPSSVDMVVLATNALPSGAFHEVVVRGGAFAGTSIEAQLRFVSQHQGVFFRWHIEEGGFGGLDVSKGTFFAGQLSEEDGLPHACLSVAPRAFFPKAEFQAWRVPCFSQATFTAESFLGLEIAAELPAGSTDSLLLVGASAFATWGASCLHLPNAITIESGAFTGALLNVGLRLGMDYDDSSPPFFAGANCDRHDESTLEIAPDAFSGLRGSVGEVSVEQTNAILLHGGSFTHLDIGDGELEIRGALSDVSSFLKPGLFSGLQGSGTVRIEFDPKGEVVQFSSTVWEGLSGFAALQIRAEFDMAESVLNFTDLSIGSLGLTIGQLSFDPEDIYFSSWENVSVSNTINLVQFELPKLPAGVLSGVQVAAGLHIMTAKASFGQPISCFPGRAFLSSVSPSTVPFVLEQVGGAGIASDLERNQFPQVCSCPPGEMPVSGGPAPICVLCQVGSACPSGRPRGCPQGTFNDDVGLVSLAGCQGCRAGTYNPFVGTNSAGCLNCPPGTASSTQNATSARDCKSCTPGTFSSGPGQQQCSLCPLGTFTDVPGQAACSPCPLGTYGTRSGGTNETDACAPCPPGQTTFSVGTPSIASCVPGSTPSTVVCPAGQSPTVRGECEACPLGHVCPDGEAEACPVGTFNNALGQSDAEESCTPCPAGTFNSLPGQTSVSCVPCSPGTASGVEGATSGSACEPCAAGSFAALAGVATCSPCAQGTYAVRARSVSCEACPVNTYGSGPGGAVVSSACLACPEGTDTAGLRGVSGLDGCVETPEEPPAQCGAGEVRDPDNSTQCLEVRCGAGLAPVGGGCVGCPAGTFGVPPTCTQCPRGGLCPGGTVSAVMSPGDLRASAPALAAAAEAGDELEAGGSSAAASESHDSEGANSSTLPQATTFTVVGVTAGCALLLPIIALVLARCFKLLQSAVKFIDAFSLDHFVLDKNVVHKASTVLGGTCTISLVAVLCGFLASSLLQYYTANTLVTTRFDPAGSAAQEAGIVTSQWRLDVAAVIDGVQSAGDCPGAQSTLDFTGGGADGVRMPWSVASGVTLQRVEAASGASALACQYAASCSECTLATTLRARLRLPYTAQSVAWAMTTTRASTPATPGQPTNSVLQGSVGASSSQRLRSGEWTLTSTREVLVDTQGGSDATGYLLAFVDQQAGFLDSSAPTSGFVPQLTPVSLQLSVQLSPSVSFITVSELQSLLGLLAALGGLAGATFGIFSFAFRFSELPVQSALSRVGLLESEDLYVPPGEESGSPAGTVKPIKEAPLASTPSGSQ